MRVGLAPRAVGPARRSRLRSVEGQTLNIEVDVRELGLAEREAVGGDLPDHAPLALVAEQHARGGAVEPGAPEQPVVEPRGAILHQVRVRLRAVLAVDEHQALGDPRRQVVEDVGRPATAGLLVLVGGGHVNRDLDPLDIGHQRARVVPLAVGVVEPLEQRVLEDRPRAARLVGRALRARALGRDQAARRAAADVVDGPHDARPQQREAVVSDAAGIDDVAVDVAEQAGRADRPQVLRPGGRDHHPGQAAVGVAEDRDVAVRPRLSGDPVVDHFAAVKRRAPAEDVELAGRAAGAAQVGEHGDVAVLEVLRVRLARAGLGRDGQPGRADDVADRRLPLVRAALVAGHLEVGRARRGGRAVVGHLDVERDARAVGHGHVVGGRGLGGRGEREEQRGGEQEGTFHAGLKRVGRASLRSAPRTPAPPAARRSPERPGVPAPAGTWPAGRARAGARRAPSTAPRSGWSARRSPRCAPPSPTPSARAARAACAARSRRRGRARRRRGCSRRRRARRRARTSPPRGR